MNNRLDYFIGPKPVLTHSVTFTSMMGFPIGAPIEIWGDKTRSKAKHQQNGVTSTPPMPSAISSCYVTHNSWTTHGAMDDDSSFPIRFASEQI